MLLDKYNTVSKGNIKYIEDKERIIRYKPWIGDIFSLSYDYIMKNMIFPRKFNAKFDRHIEILKKEFNSIHDKNVLELATGSGNTALYLNNDNNYIGIDISPMLLKKAYTRFKKFKFKDPVFYLASAEKLPFKNNTFDLCICNLSINFFNDINL